MKRVILTSMVSVFVLLQGCAVQQQVDDRSVGGLSRVGIVNDDDLLKDSFPEYMGLDQVGVHYLNPVTKGSRNTYLRRAESVILSSADYADARLNLSRALYLDPDNKTAALLMSQLVNEPSVFAQAKNFNQNSDVADYTVKKRDTIKGLSRKMYGSSNYYPFIMRYNNLSDSTLLAGAVISLPRPDKAPKPVVRKPRKVVKPAAPKPPAPTVAQPVVEPIENEPSVAITPTTVATPIEPLSKPDVTVEAEAPSLDEAKVAQDIEQGLEDTLAAPVETEGDQQSEETSAQNQEAAERVVDDSAAELETDVSAVEEVAEASTPAVEGETNVPSEPEAVEEVPQGNPLEQQALAANAAGQQIRAYRLLKQVPDRSAQGNAVLNRLTDSLVSKPYAKGLKYYQEQKLNLAIAEFNKVLAADPTHGQAGIYKARCQKLLDKLSNIE